MFTGICSLSKALLYFDVLFFGVSGKKVHERRSSLAASLYRSRDIFFLIFLGLLLAMCSNSTMSWRGNDARSLSSSLLKCENNLIVLQ